MKIDFAFEKISTKTHFEKEARGNSEMAYCISKSQLFCYFKKKMNSLFW